MSSLDLHNSASFTLRGSKFSCYERNPQLEKEDVSNRIVHFEEVKAKFGMQDKAVSSTIYNPDSSTTKYKTQDKGLTSYEDELDNPFQASIIIKKKTNMNIYEENNAKSNMLVPINFSKICQTTKSKNISHNTERFKNTNKEEINKHS